VPSTPNCRWPKPSACCTTLPAPTLPTDTAFYLQHCVKACEGGVERSHILPYATDGALLLEVFTHDGVGTMVVDEKLESLREATSDDVGGILQLIEPFERDGTLVRRERTEIERDIANYTVIEHDGIIFGCAALYPYPEARTAEMAALTVSPLSQSQGDGERMLKRIEHRAKGMGLDSIFVLTTRTMHWFIKRGFTSVDPEWLPEARKRKYNWDRRSQVLVKKFN
jgi:amino-acid N-acetyltransferase